MSTPPLVVAVHGARDVVLWVQDGRAWLLSGGPWRELAESDVAPGLGGHVLSRTQLAALVDRVGRPL